MTEQTTTKEAVNFVGQERPESSEFGRSNLVFNTTSFVKPAEKTKEGHILDDSQGFAFPGLTKKQ